MVKIQTALTHRVPAKWERVAQPIPTLLDVGVYVAGVYLGTVGFATEGFLEPHAIIAVTGSQGALVWREKESAAIAVGELLAVSLDGPGAILENLPAPERQPELIFEVALHVREQRGEKVTELWARRLQRTDVAAAGWATKAPVRPLLLLRDEA